MMGFLGTFDITFLISLANYPEKFSLVLFFSRSKPIYPGLYVMYMYHVTGGVNHKNVECCKKGFMDGGIPMVPGH